MEETNTMHHVHQKMFKIDMLHGSLWDKIPLFALPVAATVILEQLFLASDLAVVGHFSGDANTIAVAGIGANIPIIGLILNLFIGLALGVNVVIANAIGRKDRLTVTHTVHTAVVMALVIGVAVSLIGEVVAAPLLGSLNVPDDVLPSAVLFLRIYLLGLPVIMLYNFESSIFRSVGDTRMPLKVLIVSGLVNVILSLFFVAVLDLHVAGAALATVMANAVSAGVLFRLLMRPHRYIQLKVNDIGIHWDCVRSVIAIGLPAGVQSGVFTLANIVIQAAINSLGTNAIAASAAAFNLEMITYDLLNSFSQACTTFVGQNYGAGQLDRCRRIFKIALFEDIIASVAAVFLIFSFGPFLLSLFSPDPAVIELGMLRLKMVFFAYVFTVLYENMSGYMRGFGISLLPAAITTISICGSRLFWIFVVFPMHRDFYWIMMAYPVSLAVTAVCIFALLLWYRPAHRLGHGMEKLAYEG